MFINIEIFLKLVFTKCKDLDSQLYRELNNMFAGNYAFHVPCDYASRQFDDKRISHYIKHIIDFLKPHNKIFITKFIKQTLVIAFDHLSTSDVKCFGSDCMLFTTANGNKESIDLVLDKIISYDKNLDQELLKLLTYIYEFKQYKDFEFMLKQRNAFSFYNPLIDIDDLNIIDIEKLTIWIKQFPNGRLVLKSLVSCLFEFLNQMHNKTPLREFLGSFVPNYASHNGYTDYFNGKIDHDEIINVICNQFVPLRVSAVVPIESAKTTEVTKNTVVTKTIPVEISKPAEISKVSDLVVPELVVSRPKVIARVIYHILHLPMNQATDLAVAYKIITADDNLPATLKLNNVSFLIANKMSTWDDFKLNDFYTSIMELVDLNF